MVRGELFTQQEVPSYSQRIASGYLRSRDYQSNPKICFCAFQIINSNCNEYESLIYCRKLGFTIPEIVEGYLYRGTSNYEGVNLQQRSSLTLLGEDAVMDWQDDYLSLIENLYHISEAYIDRFPENQEPRLEKGG